MAGETDFVDYDNFGIELEYKWQLDSDIQELIGSAKPSVDKKQKQAIYRYKQPPTNRKDYLQIYNYRKRREYREKYARYQY